MGSKRKLSFSADVVRVVLLVLGCIFSALVLTFSVMAMTSIQNGDIESSSKYLLIIFIVLGLSRLVTFIKERTRISFVRFITLFLFDVILGVITMFAKDNSYLYSLCGGLYCLTIIISRLFKILAHRDVRSLVFNGVIMAFAVLLAIGLFIPVDYAKVGDIILIICAMVAISAFIEVVSNASSKLKAQVLFKIVLRTYALEIILGLFTMMVASALLLSMYETSMSNFYDALWYCFAVVTTIGFGDFTAVTAVGRILTVCLGIYGIIVVAVITSIIVNFYNETAGKHDVREIQDIKDEEKKK